MNPIELITALNRRYATKTFDPSKKLDDSQIDTLCEALRLSPSSFGLQPRGFVIVTDPALRSQLMAAARGQGQVADASHLFVLCRRTDIDGDYVSRYIQDVATTRGLTPEMLDGYKNMMLGFIEGKPEDMLATWAAKQVYIAQGVLLSACAMLGIDACPMEGFDAKKFDEILGLSDHNLASCVIVPVGYRSDTDQTAHYKKVRFAKEKLIIMK